MDTSIESMKTGGISKRGGARLGAGRKPKLQFEARELFNVAIDDRWEQIMQKIDGLIEKGDKDILRLCVEQRIGKAGQSLSIKNEDSARPAANLFYQPRIQVAVRVLEDQLKREIVNSVVM